MNEKDKEKWEKFIRQFERYVIEDKDSISDAKNLLKLKKGDIIKQVFGIVAFTVFIGLVIGILSTSAKMDLTFVGIALIPLAFLIFLQFDKRMKK